MMRARTILPVALAALLSACAGLKGLGKDAPAAVVAATPVTPTAPAAETPAIRPITPGPVPRTCVPRTLSPAPRYPDSDAALRDAPGAADRYQLMAAGRLLRQRRLEELERIIAGCR
jgi:hypothetical protein